MRHTLRERLASLQLAALVLAEMELAALELVGAGAAALVLPLPTLTARDHTANAQRDLVSLQLAALVLAKTEHRSWQRWSLAALELAAGSRSGRLPCHPFWSLQQPMLPTVRIAHRGAATEG